MIDHDPLAEIGGAIVHAWDRVQVQRRKGEFEKYRDDPVGFIEKVLGKTPWGAAESPTGKPGQREIAQAIADFDDIAWATCHGAGKTTLLTWICLWFWTTRPNSIVVSTAPTHKQVEGLLWREIRDAHANSATPLPGIVLTQKADMPGYPSWYMEGFSTDTPKGAQAAVTAQGKHAKGGLLLVVDEASGVPEGVFNTARGYRTGGGVKRVYIGNQNMRQGSFHDALHSESSTFQKFQTSAFDVPQFIAGHELMRPKWIEEMRQECGPDPDSNPMYQVQVLGLPPSSDQDSLISLSLLEENADLNPLSMGRTIGVDIARMGKDKCVAYLNDRGRIKARHEWEQTRTHESAEIIVQLMKRWDVPDATDVKVDGTGVGGGVVDDLFRRGLYVEYVDFGAGPKGDWEEIIGTTVNFPKQGGGRRHELHYVFQKLMRLRLLSIPARYKQAWADAVSLRLVNDRQMRWKVEDKPTMKARIGRSPDDTDAILCSLSRAGVTEKVVGTGAVFRRRRRR